MSREVPYEKQTIDHPNPVARYAHQQRYLNSLRLVDALLPRNGTILDFGAGQGEFMHRLGTLRPDVRLLAYEPFMTMKYSEITVGDTMDLFEDGSVDLVCAFETLEHISDQLIEDFVSQSIRICRRNARIIVSIPVMQGAILPVKQIVRSVLFRRLSDYSIGEMLRGVFGLSVRRAENILLSHKGFDHRALLRLLTKRLTLLQTSYSPFAGLPWWLNSQVFFVFAIDQTPAAAAVRLAE